MNILFLKGCVLSSGKPLPKTYHPLQNSMLAGFTKHSSPINSLASSMKLIMINPSQRVKTEASLLLKRPSSYRIELDGVMGIGGANACDGTSFYWLDTHERELLYSDAVATAHTLPILSLPLTCTEMVGLLLGTMPGMFISQGSLAYHDDIGKLVYRYSYNGYVWELYYEPMDKPPAQLEKVYVYLQGQLVWKVVIKEIDINYQLPVHIRFEYLPEDVVTDVTLFDVEFNPSLSNDLFQLPCPRQYQCKQL